MENKITDKGWTVMREMLDREMPEKRRRRFGWWWFALLLLPLAVYGSWHWLLTPETPSPKPTSTEQVASISPASAASINLPSAQITHTSAATNDKPRASISPKASITTAHQFSKAKIATLPYTIKPVAPLKDNRDVANKVQDNEGLIPQANGSTNPAPAEPLSLKPQLSLESIATVPQAIELQEDPEDVYRPITNFDLPRPAKKTSFKSWAFGASSAISTEQFSTINGFATGITVDWKFARKWGLRTGLWYDIHHPQAKYRPVASVRSESYTSNVEGNVIVVDLITGNELVNQPGNNFYADSLAGNVYIPVNRLQRLDIPATVFWQATSSLKILGGLNLTRTLTAKAERQNYSGEYILKLADRTAADGASKLSSTELDNWSVDAMFGLGVKLGKSFELGISAKMPLNTLPSYAKNNAQGVSAGSAENILGSTRKQNSPVFSLSGTLFF